MANTYINTSRNRKIVYMQKKVRFWLHRRIRNKMYIVLKLFLGYQRKINAIVLSSASFLLHSHQTFLFFTIIRLTFLFFFYNANYNFPSVRNIFLLIYYFIHGHFYVFVNRHHGKTIGSLLWKKKETKIKQY